MVLKHVERSAVNQFLVIARDVIKSKKLRFGDILVDSREVSTNQAKAKYPDFALLDTKNIRPLYIIEFKPPTWTPYDPILVEDAHNKASKEGCKYFGTCNFNKLVIWRTDLAGVPLMERYMQEYDLMKIRTLNDISVKLVQTKLKKKLEEVLQNLEDIYYGKITVKKKAIDEFFIDMLRSAIDSFSVPIVDSIAEAYKLDTMFQNHLVGWFVEHGWTFQNNLESFEKVAKQYLLLLINKVLFYNTLKLHHPTLKALKFSTDENESKFYRQLTSFFDKVLEIDYESIYNSEFIDSVPIPSEVIPQLASFINSLSDKYDFAKVNYEIMGRIFENLIPQEERHKYGQFFTDSNVVDLINTFCIKDADANVLDSSCGAGTFLVRAYNLKKLMDTSQDHENIIKELYGFDLSKFASHLANINLSIKDLKANESYPRIINDDFFNIKPKDKFKDHQKAKALSGALINLEVPMMDAVVGNPPYTRQEELKQLFGDSYKDKLNALLDHEFQVKLSGNASVYAHFFVHGTAFLKNGGRFGYITTNSWLDVGYGKVLQKFFLDNYKIVAIIDSKVERWFEYADVNTVITILERCKDKNKRDNNTVKFVQLKDKLENFFPFVQVSEDEETTLKREKRRLSEIIKFIKQIETSNTIYEDNLIKIIPKKQISLIEEEKWGQFIRAPPVFFNILNKYDESFVKLEKIAKLKYAIKTGDNNFFYFDNNKQRLHAISNKYLKPIVKSGKDSKKIILSEDIIKQKILFVNDMKGKIEDKNLLTYLEHGEKQKVNKKPTCANRSIWYSFSEWSESPILMPEGGVNDRYITFLNPQDYLADKRLFRIIPYDLKYVNFICAYYNSTLFSFFAEILGRTSLGQGALDFRAYEVQNLMPIVDLEKATKSQLEKIDKVFERICKRDIMNVFDEINNKDHKELDSIFFDILGVTKNERKEVYTAVIDLVSSRLNRAKSVVKKKVENKMSEKAIIEHVSNEVDALDLDSFPDDYIEHSMFVQHYKIPKTDFIKVGSDLVHGFFVELSDGKRISCESEIKAFYIQYAVMNKKLSFRIPSENKHIKKIVDEYAKKLKELKKNIEKSLKFYVSDEKVKNKLFPDILNEVLKNVK